MGNFDAIFNCLLSMSNSQIDEKAKRRIEKLLGRSNEDIKDELLGLIDDMVFFSLASNIVIISLDYVWKSCGGTKEELRTRSVADTPENREKYKWER